MSYRLEILPSAERELASLTRRDRERVDKRIVELGGNPRPPGTKTLKGKRGLLRIRIGSLHVVFEVDDRERIIRVTRIGQRGGVYRRT